MIQEKVEAILNGAFARYAAEYGVTEDEIQIRCVLSVQGSDFQVLRNYKTQKPITVMELLNKKMDFTGMAGAIEIFIHNKLVKICQESAIDPAKAIAPDDISGIISKGENEFMFHIYNKTKFVETLTLENVLGEKVV